MPARWCARWYACRSKVGSTTLTSEARQRRPTRQEQGRQATSSPPPRHRRRHHRLRHPRHRRRRHRLRHPRASSQRARWSARRFTWHEEFAASCLHRSKRTPFSGPRVTNPRELRLVRSIFRSLLTETVDSIHSFYLLDRPTLKASMLSVVRNASARDRDSATTGGSGADGKEHDHTADSSTSSRPAQRLLLFYTVLACLCFWSSFGPHYIGLDNDVHHKVEMRLISYTILAYGTTGLRHTTHGQGEGIRGWSWPAQSSHLRWVLPFIAGWFMMGLAYLKDVPKTSEDYLYYRAVTWCFFTYQLCVAAERFWSRSAAPAAERHTELHNV